MRIEIINGVNNEKQELQQKYFMDKMENQHKTEMNELREKLNKLEKRKVGGIRNADYIFYIKTA
jgi:hypothetical protein